MGTTFVSLDGALNQPADVGFWMRDEILELWLRLLALHLPEPTDDKEFATMSGIRSNWLLASRGYFTGAVPDRMGEICVTVNGRRLVLTAINSLMNSLDAVTTPLDGGTLNLLGNEQAKYESIERHRLKDVGQAFLDLIHGNFTGKVNSTEVMPGSTPYRRNP